MSDVDWGAQVRAMTSSWLEAQQALWRAWGELASAATGGPGKVPSVPDIADEWQKVATQSLQAWTAMTDPVARSAAEQFVAAQGVMLRFAEFAARAWDAAAPRIRSGEDWQAALAAAMEELRRRWVQFPADTVAISQDVGALWRLYLEQWQSFGQPWAAALRNAPSRVGRAAAGDSAALFELSDAYRDAYQQTFGRLASSPTLGLTRELVQKLQGGFDAWVAWQLASAEYQAVLSEIWDKAFKGFGEDLVALAEKGEKIDSVRELVLLWTRGAERVFTDAFRTERYAAAQSKLLGASMRSRVSQREIIEECLKLYDLPTRSELDEAHRRIYELRREIRALKKQLAALSAAAGRTGAGEGDGG